MLPLLGLHAAVALLVVAVGSRLGPRVFWLAALPLATTCGWALVHATAVLDGRPVVEHAAWAPTLGLTLSFRLDALSLLFVALVAGIGTGVLLYCPHYFGRSRANPRTAATLVAFAGAMLGLVLADDVLLLYVFWELTSIASFLLIGHDEADDRSRYAAQQSLLVTVAGGLCLLAGGLLIGHAAGTYTISGILSAPPSGPAVVAGVVLLALAAFTKSAQVPFHPWLPAAMAAPTPVSAYLHAASMVKAGVYLLARLAPALAVVGPWRPLGITVGLATMLIGGYRALRQTDLKRLLAFGTVSQLGFMTVLAAAGTPAALQALAMVLLAHGLFKAALFLVVGVIDHQTGTRDLRRLSGLARRMPWLAAIGWAAALSMAGVPPLVGFVAKEGAYDAFVHGGPGGAATLAGLIAGSVLTVAYSLRFATGAFGGSLSGRDGLSVRGANSPRPGPASTAVPAVLALLTVGIGLVPGAVDGLVGPLAHAAGDEPLTGLALWHGATVTLALGLATLAAGVAVWALADRVEVIQRIVARVLPDWLDADRGYSATLRGTETGAARITGTLQSGSLPAYLTLILVTLLALPGTVLLTQTRWPESTVWFAGPEQAVVAVAAVVAAVATARARRRFAAVLFLGAVGYAVALLFVLQGAPDLALTQFLIETLSVVVFVLVLRRLPDRFSRPAVRASRVVRLLVAGGVGVFMAGFALVAAGARTGESISSGFLARALPEGGGHNVVNVILVDFRGFDTFGEITVLVVAALGVFNLVRAPHRRETSRDGEHDEP